MKTDIEHTGTVFDIVGKRIDVAVTAHSACSSCKVKGICGMSETEQKNISVMVEHPEFFEIGETVNVSVTSGMGVKAVLMAYIYPFFILLASLLILSSTNIGEVMTGTISLGVTVLYYVALYFFRNRIEKEIIFKISKYNG